MDIGDALRFLRMGLPLRRREWMHGVFLLNYLDTDIPFHLISVADNLNKELSMFQTISMELIFKKHLFLVKNGSIDKKWQPDTTDLLASDWGIATFMDYD